MTHPQQQLIWMVERLRNVMARNGSTSVVRANDRGEFVTAFTLDDVNAQIAQLEAALSAWADREHGDDAGRLSADRPENTTDHPKSWIAWKRRAEAAETRLAALSAGAQESQGPATLIDAKPFVDTPLKQAIRRAFDYPTIINIEEVASAALSAGAVPQQEPQECVGCGGPPTKAVCDACFKELCVRYVAARLTELNGGTHGSETGQTRNG
jgi:hypothetical protein